MPPKRTSTPKTISGTSRISATICSPDQPKITSTTAADSDPADLQTAVFDVGKAHNFENLRDWFRALYEILLGQSQGPRMGSFIALYGVAETVALIDRALNGEDLAA